MGEERVGRVPVILLPESLRHVLGEAASRDFVEVLNVVAGTSQDRLMEWMDQRFSALEAKLTRATTELRTEIAQVRTELRAEIAQVRTELRAEIESKVSRAEARLIKWAFAFWASGVTALIVAILLK